jgi:hypothetical protein
MGDYSTLSDFRNKLYHCFGNGKDALMNACDAVASSTNAHSFAELSLSPFFGRQWPSLYEAFDDARIDSDALAKLFIDTMPPVPDGERRILAGDITSILRPESPTARDRTYVHVSNIPKGAKPVLPGWQFATIVALPYQPSSWTSILCNTRIKSDEKPTEVVAQLLAKVAADMPEDTAVMLDGSFGNANFLEDASNVPMGKLMRTAKNRTFYRPTPVKEKGKRGRPRLDGEPFSLNKPETQGIPDKSWSGVDIDGYLTNVECWHSLHFRKCRDIDLSVIRVTRLAGPDTKRNPRVIWLIWQGPCMPAIEKVPNYYRLRYCIEHSYRFDKQKLHWADARLRTPEKFQAWTDILSAAHNQITIARTYQQDIRLPWAKHNTDSTPSQIRAGMPRIITTLGTPARCAQVRGKSPGRPIGAVINKATRFKTVLKQAT